MSLLVKQDEVAHPTDVASGGRRLDAGIQQPIPGAIEQLLVLGCLGASTLTVPLARGGSGTLIIASHCHPFEYLGQFESALQALAYM